VSKQKAVAKITAFCYFVLNKRRFNKMKKVIAEETIAVPKTEYRFLKELYRTVKRQNFLLRVEEAEKNLKAGKVKKISIDKFIEGIDICY